MTRFILGAITNPSMSEKKSSIKNEKTCTLCAEVTGDFLELEDFSDNGFILCASCEATSTTEDIYGATYEHEYASPRKGVPNIGPNPRIAEIVASIKENFQETEKINAK